MKSNYQEQLNNSSSSPLSREDRRKMHKRLLPKIKRIVELEKQIKSGLNKEAAESEINEIIETLTMMEMFAIEDYIYNHNLLPSLENK